MTQAIIFDFGNVIALPQDQVAWQAHLDALADELGFEDGAAMWAYLYEGEAWQLAKTGRISDDAFWRRLLEPLGLDTRPAQDLWVRRLYGPLGGVHPRVRELLEQLKDRYRLALLSNASDWLETGLREMHQIDTLFDVIVISALVGLAKPGTRFVACALCLTTPMSLFDFSIPIPTCSLDTVWSYAFC